MVKGEKEFSPLSIPPNFHFFLKKFKENPWETIDSVNLSFHGFQFNVLRNDVKLRKAVFDILFVVPALMWVCFGPDSTMDQVANTVINLPNFFLGVLSLEDLFKIFNSWYGLGTHWSAAVIYSLFFIGLSMHLRSLNIKNSLNLGLTTGFTGITIASFEFYWQICFSVFQNQPWVLWFQYPQARILLQNFEFMLVGLFALLVVFRRGFTLNFNRYTTLCFLGAVFLMVFWIYYPFATNPLTVGDWTSSLNFPQTMYTIQMEPTQALGALFHVENPGVHLTNNLAKIMLTLTFYSLFKIKRRGKHEQ